MRARSVMAIVSLLFTATVGLTGQQRPNFTGIWNGGIETDTIDHQDPNLTVHIETHGDAGTLRFGLSDDRTFTTDGSERHSLNDNGRETWRTASWAGTTLVFLTVEKERYHVTVTRVTWALSGDGRRLTKATRVIDMDGVREGTVALTRQ